MLRHPEVDLKKSSTSACDAGQLPTSKEKQGRNWPFVLSLGALSRLVFMLTLS